MSVTAVVLALPPLTRLRGLGARRIAAVAAGITFLAVVAWSSGLALRGSRVAPAQHDDQLAALRPMLRGSPTLYMGQNNYVPWELRGVKLSFPYIDIGQSQSPFDTRPDKGWTVESTFDFDNVDPQYLDTARSFGLNRLEIILRVKLPDILPFAITGLRMPSRRSASASSTVATPSSAAPAARAARPT